MTFIKFNNQTFETENGETVLDALLRNNMQVPYGDTRSGDGINQAHVTNLGFVGQVSSIPSRFSANEIK